LLACLLRLAQLAIWSRILASLRALPIQENNKKVRISSQILSSSKNFRSQLPTQFKNVVCNIHPISLPSWCMISPWRHAASRECLQAFITQATSLKYLHIHQHQCLFYLSHPLYLVIVSFFFLNSFAPD
jgi:hypothetical protein